MRPVVDIALATVDIVAVVYVMRGAFKRHRLLAEARRHLSYVRHRRIISRKGGASLRACTDSTAPAREGRGLKSPAYGAPDGADGGEDPQR
ncbi:hypothetical protein SUDANB23_06592 (plasmid) [Streptomyces sp. enrichment culture]